LECVSLATCSTHLRSSSASWRAPPACHMGAQKTAILMSAPACCIDVTNTTSQRHYGPCKMTTAHLLRCWLAGSAARGAAGAGPALHTWQCLLGPLLAPCLLLFGFLLLLSAVPRVTGSLEVLLLLLLATPGSEKTLWVAALSQKLLLGASGAPSALRSLFETAAPRFFGLWTCLLSCAPPLPFFSRHTACS
jgi:hypothetical protein